jgi:hypothetical protein
MSSFFSDDEEYDDDDDDEPTAQYSTLLLEAGLLGNAMNKWHSTLKNKATRRSSAEAEKKSKVEVCSTKSNSAACSGRTRLMLLLSNESQCVEED